MSAVKSHSLTLLNFGGRGVYGHIKIWEGEQKVKGHHTLKLFTNYI